MDKDIVSGACVTVLGAAALAASAGFPTAPSAAADPALLPRAVSAGLVVTGVCMVALGLRGRRAAPALGSAHVPEDMQEELAARAELPPAPRLALAVFAVLAGYATAAFQLGYLSTTVVFLVALPVLLGWGTDRRRTAVLAVFAVGLTAAMYIGFFLLLGVPLPRTPLP
ncbi:tripartite tricarboxylate transporter TctB family protein [Pseudonocardia kunmingensis]|uniref:Tripartite tricarboxylate transporter TctB family protein n=1 Tax=Pseudonocardia kunmingensis TaxID=630975 RepID=A0A543E0G6_9PSEU|nr:tripartite tricarboxylate transporter TctB family protein [Pseudonocardia kunmingensis]TQM15068.1 tripartite tricarboxylate transporter TctB family protein [Pseudonocardia kunmingensis]